MVRLIVLLSILFPISIFGDMNLKFQDYLSYGESIPNVMLEDFNPRAIFKDYTTDVDQSKHYQGEIQGSDQSITNSLNNKNQIKEDIKKSFLTRPIYEIDPREIKEVKKIEENGDNLEGIRKRRECKNIYSYHTCYYMGHLKEEHCQEELKVTVEHQQKYPKYLKITLRLQHRGDGYIEDILTLNLLTREITTKHDVWNISGKIDNTLTTEMLRDPGFSIKWLEYFVTYHKINNDSFIDKEFIPANRSNNFTQELHFRAYTRGWQDSFILRFYYQINPLRIVHKNWQGDCQRLKDLEREGICYLKNSRCLKDKMTKTINNMDITENCWQREFTYHCNRSDTPIENNCKDLIDRGCEQIFSSCYKKRDGICITHKQKYRCLKGERCTTEEIDYGDNIFCIDNSCRELTAKSNRDFDRAVSFLAIIGEISKEIEANQSRRVFAGEVKRCRDYAIDFSNCCSDSGWGQDLGLANCQQEERDLGIMKQKGLVHLVGRYCDKKVLGTCVQHKKSYCVFSSKIARIVQQQGREQLEINFGSPENPNCRSLSIEELQRLNLSEIDLSEIYQDIRDNIELPNKKSLGDKTAKRIQEFYNKEQYHA